ncbi:MAG: HD domain-containing phosphohydrolase [Bryobacteraceae bacterium]
MRTNKTTMLAVLAVSVLLATGLSTQLGQWELRDPSYYLFYLGVALLAFGLRAKAPARSGQPVLEHTSMGFVFVIVALTGLSLRESLQIAFSTILILSIWRKRSDPDVILADLLCTGTSALAANAVYQATYLLSHQVEQPVRLVVASCVCFVANQVPMIAVAAATQRDWMRKTRQLVQFWAFPYYLMAAAIAVLFSYAQQFVNWQVAMLAAPAVFLTHRSYRLYVDRLERQREHSGHLAELHLRAIEALSLAIEAKDATPDQHLRRVQVYTMEMGRALRMTDKELEALRAAAVLHDIGTLAIPEHITAKPGRLTPEEFEKVKIHTQVGAEILERVQFPYPVAPLVRSHHERWDGTGYPDGLRGTEIPLGARILAVADTVDALASERRWRAALPLQQAIARAAAMAGTAFDPRIIELLVKHFEEWERVAQLQGAQRARLSIGAKVERGDAPAAGFEASGVTRSGDFLKSISAAREEEQLLLDLNQQLGNSIALQETFAGVASRLKKLVPYQSVVLFIQRGDRLLAHQVAGDHISLCSSLQIPIGRGVSGWVAANGKPMRNADPALEITHLSGGGRTSPFASSLSVPLSTAAGLQGALTLYHAQSDAFSAEHLRLMLAVAPKLAQAVENGLKFKRAEDSATFDFLTSLPNAHSLFEQLEREIDVSRCLESPLAVLVCDLDGFKPVNDRLGHLTGNQVLRAVSLALKQGCQEYDYAARMGGDEFVIVLPNRNKREIEMRIQQLRQAIVAAGFEVCGEELVGASFGAAQYPQDGSTVDELLAAADREMYRDKEARKAGVSARKIGPQIVIPPSRRAG